VLTIGARQRLRFELTFDGPCEATSPRPRCVELVEFEARPDDAEAPAP